MKGRLIDFSTGYNRKQRVTIELDSDFREGFDALHDVDVEVTIKKWRDKRSIDANNYMWRLLEDLAIVTRQTKEHLYLDFIKRFGLFKDFTLTQDEAKTFRVAWSNLGTGWPTEQVDFDPDGDRVVIRAYYGSSTYNTKQMSRLVDAVIDECKAQGIDTDTPAEKAKWNR